jgi:hypothetical protein
MNGSLDPDPELSAWTSATPAEPGPFKRLMRMLVSLGTRRPVGEGYDEREPPPEGAGVPARPKRPAPTLLAAAELELTRDSS